MTTYNYELQCWIVDGKVAECGHVEETDGCTSCFAAGMTEKDALEL